MPEIQVPVEQSYNPEIIPDERFAALLSSIGNHEGKALLLIGMSNGPSDTTYGRTALQELMRSLPGSDNAYLGNEGNQLDWCNSTLAPIGLVAKSDYSKTLTYGITPEGKVTGKALAGFMLDFSDRYEIALLDVMGTTHSRNNNRSPATRLRIIECLLDSNEPIPYGELVRMAAHSSKSSASHQLSALDARGLIEYDSKNRNTEVPSFLLKDKGYEPKPGKVFAPLIIEALRDNESATVEEILQYAMKIIPAEEIGLDEKTYRARIYGGLHGLKRREVVGVINLRGPGTHGMASLTDEQRKFWSELSIGLRRIQTQDSTAISDYTALANEFIKKSGKVYRALSRASESSTLAQNGTEKRTSVLVEGALHQSIGFISVREIVEQITKTHGRTLSQESVRVAIKDMQATGRIRSKPGIQKPVYELMKEVTSTD